MGSHSRARQQENSSSVTLGIDHSKQGPIGGLGFLSISQSFPKTADFACRAFHPLLYLKMLNVYDLHFKKELLPLFDFLHNEFSRMVLEDLLSDIPGSVDEIYERQDILKALLKHRHLYVPFSYSKAEFNQVYGYIEEKRNKGTHLSGNSLKIHLLLSRNELNRERGSLYQLVHFFNKINEFYFTRLDTDALPSAFAHRVENIRWMMTDLEVERYYRIGRKRAFSLLEATRLLELLYTKIDNGTMTVFWKDFFLFEACYSISKGIEAHNFVFPVFTGEGLSIDGLYHPLLKHPVRNSIGVRDAVTLITGPNMSGKSTLLKSIGLCVYLAHLGLGVPAQECRLPFFDAISIAINLQDDMKNGYSHFMNEIQTLKKVIVEARNGRRCFVIFDELFRGTNIEDALAIFKMTMVGLTGFQKSFFFISTHLHQLEETAREHAINACCIECKLDNGMPIFTYKLIPGWSDLKIGQLIFRQEGLDDLLRPSAG